MNNRKQILFYSLDRAPIIQQRVVSGSEDGSRSEVRRTKLLPPRPRSKGSESSATSGGVGDGEPSVKEVIDCRGNSLRLIYLPRLDPSSGRNSCPRQTRSNQRTEGHTGHPPASRASPDKTTLLTDVEDNRAGTLK